MKISLFSRQRDGQDSFEELVMPYMNDLHRLAYHYCGQQADAEDLVQELLIKLYRRADEIQRVEKLRPWLAKSLYHLFIDRVRQQRRAPVDAVEPQELAQMGEQGDTGQSSEKLALVANIEQALQQLSDEQRMVVLLHDVENYTLAELETILDTPIGTLKSRLHRSRAKLREILSAEGTISLSTACI
jgi:RNA polymerase sigma-70 factor (ECF subfamily)